MPDSHLTNSTILAAYRERTPSSAQLATEAQQLFPSGITHDSRYLLPYGIYVERAAGARKWDADGNEYIDYFGGHGALLLGHSHPQVTAAIGEALQAGTHFGTGTRREVRWASVVKRLVPSAERLRFTSSGTEATLMALRLARAFTGRRKIIRLRTHFHGWNDHMASGQSSHFDGSATTGVLPGVAENVILLDPGDIPALKQTLESDSDVAGLIFEPTGASFGMVPLSPDYLTAARELTSKHGVVLIFDEVVTGFRVSRGGAQAQYGITPDLQLAKILAGGLPGGALVGRKEILDALDHEVTKAAGREKVQHQGTFNANPVSAAAGATTLETIESSDACARANDSAAILREGVNRVLTDMCVPWACYGTFSGFHIFLNPKNRTVTQSSFDPERIPFDELKGASPELSRKLKLALLVNGVDIQGRAGGLLSAAHTRDDIDLTVNGFCGAVRMLKEDGDI